MCVRWGIGLFRNDVKLDTQLFCVMHENPVLFFHDTKSNSDDVKLAEKQETPWQQMCTLEQKYLQHNVADKGRFS